MPNVIALMTVYELNKRHDKTQYTLYEYMMIHIFPILTMFHMLPMLFLIYFAVIIVLDFLRILSFFYCSRMCV